MKINIKDKLKEKNMSRYELAKRINVSYPTISSIYNGESTSIKFEILEAICIELDCTPNDIIIVENETPSNINLIKRLKAYYEYLNKHTEK